MCETKLDHFQGHLTNRPKREMVTVQAFFLPQGMHSRTAAIGRTYVYKIISPATVERVSCFDYNECWPFDRALNLNAMREAASHLKGKHDFSSFRGAGCSAKTPVRYIEELEVEEQRCGPVWAPSSRVSLVSSEAMRCITVRVRAKSFLYHQVRYMVAWLVSVGAGDRPASDTPEVILARSVAALGVKTAPSWGLFLCEVHYDPAFLDTLEKMT